MMRITTLVFIGVFAVSTFFNFSIAHAQCSSCVRQDSLCPPPNPNGGNLEMSVCGDTAIFAIENSVVDHNITLALPREFSIRSGNPIVPGFPISFPFDIGIFVDTLIIADIAGLPTGFTWESDSVNNGNLYIPPASLYGCIKICGQLDCESAGLYPLKLKFTTVQRVDINGLPSGAQSFQALIQQALADANGDTLELDLTLDVAASSTQGLAIAFGGTSTLIDSGQTITLTATEDYDTYSWSTGDSTASINASPTDTTTYYVTVTDSLGCTQTDSIEIQVQKVETPVNTGLNTNQLTELSIYPNPNQGIFTLKIWGSVSSAYSLRIFNLQGSNVFEKHGSFANEKQLLTDISNLETGIYLIKLQISDKVFTQKLILNKN